MYSKMFRGKKIRMNNYHYKSLLERFNSSNFEPKIDPYDTKVLRMQSNIPCSLCKAYFKRRRRVPTCGKCPLIIFETDDPMYRHYLGCSYILKQLAPAEHVYVGVGRAVYLHKNSCLALEELRVLTDFLKSFKKE